MYFGAITRVHIHPDLLEDFMAYNEEQNQRASESGVAIIAYQSASDPYEFYTALVAEDEATYRNITESPEQLRDYLRLVDYLDEEPEWHDGSVAFCQFPQPVQA